MQKIVFCLMAFGLMNMSLSAQKLNNMFYAFNNSVRTLQNAPEGMDAQAQLISEIGFKGFAGHHSENYFARRNALDKAGIEMPEIYLPVTINESGKVSYFEGIREIIKDSKNRKLVVALAAFGDAYKNNKADGDRFLVESIQELADFAAPFGVRIAVYPHVGFYCERLDHSIKICKEVNRPNVGAIFNTCHLFKVEGMEGWEQKLKEAIPFLYMISINGLDSGDTQSMNWDRLIQPLGEGSFDTYQIVKIAKDNGYNGLFGLQCYNIKQDCKTALIQSMKTWKSYLEKYQIENK